MTGAGEAQSEAARLTCVRVHWHVRSSVHILPVPDCDHENQEPVIVYLVDHAVGSDPDAPGWATGEFLAAGGPGIDCEIPYCSNDALLLRSVDPSELLLGNSQDIDRVVHAS
jgi:hypothetical protein